jgi:hypothetical protein
VSAPSPLAEVLAALGATLARLELRWYLFGAQAVVFWGRPRTSLDIDVTVELDLARVPAFIDGLGEAGFELRIRAGVEDFVRRTRVLPFLHAETGTPVDVVLAGPGLEEGFLARAISVRVGEVEVPVISPEDLIVTKLLAGRPKDLEDVRGILAERAAGLDFAAIRALLRQLEEALGQSDLLPRLEAELRGSDLAPG